MTSEHQGMRAATAQRSRPADALRDVRRECPRT